jgi:hypothetical protein
MMTMEHDRLSYVPARGGRQHLKTLIARMDRTPHGAAWDAPRAIARGAQLLERRGVIIVISDYYDAEDETRRELRRAAQRGHDVAMLQIVSPAERALPFDGQVEIEELESGERRLVDAAAVAGEYRANVAAFLERCRSEALRDGVDYALLSTDSPPEVALRDYLLRRARRTPAAVPRAVAK